MHRPKNDPYQPFDAAQDLRDAARVSGPRQTAQGRRHPDPRPRRPDAAGADGSPRARPRLHGRPNGCFPAAASTGPTSPPPPSPIPTAQPRARLEAELLAPSRPRPGPDRRARDLRGDRPDPRPRRAVRLRRRTVAGVSPGRRPARPRRPRPTSPAPSPRPAARAASTPASSWPTPARCWRPNRPPDPANWTRSPGSRSPRPAPWTCPSITRFVLAEVAERLAVPARCAPCPSSAWCAASIW